MSHDPIDHVISRLIEQANSLGLKHQRIDGEHSPTGSTCPKCIYHAGFAAGVKAEQEYRCDAHPKVRQDSPVRDGEDSAQDA